MVEFMKVKKAWEEKFGKPEKKKDPILNPELFKTAGVKITRPNSKSPDNLYTNHTHYNKDLFPFAGSTVLLKRKGCKKDGNRSEIVLSSSLGELIPIKFDPKI